MVVFAERDEFHEPGRSSGSDGSFRLLETMFFVIGGDTDVFTSFCR